jgi:regulator of sigma E protease
MFSTIGHTLLLAFGFGFVIFWHELGHFAAMKWAGVRVEQFAVGMFNAIFSWRKGIGFRLGSTRAEYERRTGEYLERAGTVPNGSENSFSEYQRGQAALALGISETEYRLNFMPIGGYVKPTGQDDLRPQQEVHAEDPGSYGAQPVGKRMVILSAGVIMNVILAGVLFTYIFTVGMEVPEPVVGGVQAGSPASQTYRLEGNKQVFAPLQVGDTIEELDGRTQTDFDKIALNTFLSTPNEPIPVLVKRAKTGLTETVWVTPRKSKPDAPFPQIGIEGYHTLKTIPPEDHTGWSAAQIQAAEDKLAAAEKLSLPEESLLKPGQTIIAADGKPVKTYRELYDIEQAGQGNPLVLKVQDDATGTTQDVTLPAHLGSAFGGTLSLAGMEMLNEVDSITADSPAVGKLEPGDVVTVIADAAAGGKWLDFPTGTQLLDFIHQAADRKSKLRFTVVRAGKEMSFEMTPSINIEPGKKGLGVGLGVADKYPVVADVDKESPAGVAGLPGGARITAVDGKPVTDWLGVVSVMRTIKPGQPFDVVATPAGRQSQTFHFKGLSADQAQQIGQVQFTSFALGLLAPDTYPRKVPTGQVWKAGWWGILETRDAILQVKMTVMSMARGSISATQVSGPVGILSAGYKIAEKGTTRLVWFLAIISANLAVMNLLPIPILDGGHLAFLIVEKIKGSPVSQRIQNAAQMSGLVLLLCIFVFATWQDIARLPFMFHG